MTGKGGRGVAGRLQTEDSGVPYDTDAGEGGGGGGPCTYQLGANTAAARETVPS